MIKTTTILLATFLMWFEVCVLGIPIPLNVTGSPWENMASEQQNLQPFQAYLLNKTVLPFLNDCYSGNCCKKAEQLFCPTYYEMVIRLNGSKHIEKLTENAIQDMQRVQDELKPETATEFCGNFSKIIPELTLRWNASDIRNPLKESMYCTAVCFLPSKFSENGVQVWFTLKPFCKTISWMAGLSGNETISSNVNAPSAQIDVQAAEGEKLPPPIKVEASKVAEIPSITKEEKNRAGDKYNATKANAIPQKKVDEKQATNKTDIQTPKEKATGGDPSMSAEKANNGTRGEGPVLKDSPNTNIDKPQIAGTPAVEKGLSEQPKEIPEGGQKDSNNEASLGKIPNDQVNEANAEINQEDTDDVFQQDIQKSEPILYSAEDDNGMDDIRPPQVDTKSGVRDQSIEKLIESNLRDITQKTGVGVSANYIPASDPFYEEAGSNFFTYFLVGMFICILLYVLYHNKTKVFALILEGRRSQKGRSGRRKHTAQYTKLDTNLEEAITSSASARSSQIIY